MRVSAVIGARSEAIVFAFGRCDRTSLFRPGPNPTKYLDRITGEHVDMGPGLLAALVEIEAANMLEQTPGLMRLDADIREALPGTWSPRLAMLSHGAREDLTAYLKGEISITKIRNRAGIPFSD